MKLPNGYGTVYKLSGKRRNPYVAKKTKGWEINQETGKAKQLYTTIGYYPTRKEALSALAEYNANPYDVDVAKLTFADVYDRWSTDQFPQSSASTVAGYKASWLICSKIASKCFVEIKLYHLQKLVDESGKNAPTLEKLKTTLSLIYKYAVIHEIIPRERDMVKYLNIKKAENPNSISHEPFSDEELEKLWDSRCSNEYYSVILIAVYTGVRISELLALRKENVYLDERWFKVEKSKTKAGIRSVPIAEKIVPLFKYWLARPCDYLICSPENKPLGYHHYYHTYWIPLLINVGMGKLVNEPDKRNPVYYGHRPHDTRHTCVSLLTAAGVDERVIRKIVGHKGNSVTEVVYTHFDITTLLDAINKI